MHRDAPDYSRNYSRDHTPTCDLHKVPRHTRLSSRNATWGWALARAGGRGHVQEAAVEVVNGPDRCNAVVAAVVADAELPRSTRVGHRRLIRV
jgi:hypothetical protein